MPGLCVWLLLLLIYLFFEEFGEDSFSCAPPFSFGVLYVRGKSWSLAGTLYLQSDIWTNSMAVVCYEEEGKRMRENDEGRDSE